MKKGLPLIALIILLIAAFIGFRKKSSLGTAENKEASPTGTVQEQISPTIVVPRLTTQVQGQAKTVVLTVSEPSNNFITTNSSIIVKGKTIGNADVSINDKDVKANAQGNFSAVVSLDEGENIISVLAVDQEGNFVEQDLIVTLNSAVQLNF